MREVQFEEPWEPGPWLVPKDRGPDGSHRSHSSSWSDSTTAPTGLVLPLTPGTVCATLWALGKNLPRDPFHLGFLFINLSMWNLDSCVLGWELLGAALFTMWATKIRNREGSRKDLTEKVNKTS